MPYFPATRVLNPRAACIPGVLLPILLSTVQSAFSADTVGISSPDEMGLAVLVEEQPLSATFYADGSCLLRISSSSTSGKTIIDANINEHGSRMMIHCATLEHQQLTLMADNETLKKSERTNLLTAEEIDEGETGILAWLSSGESDSHRRFLSSGQLLMRSTPVTRVDGAALQADQQFFATVSGTLEPVLANVPDDAQGGFGGESSTESSRDTQTTQEPSRAGARPDPSATEPE